MPVFRKTWLSCFCNSSSHHRAQQIDRQSALQTSQKEKNDRIPFTLTFHPHNNPVKAIILNNFKILQNDPKTGAIFSQLPLISFKRDKNVGNFLVRNTFKTIEKPGTFKCARSRCKTCPFVQNADKISGPKRSVKITDRFTCTSANVIYCITCTLCKKLYIGETGRRLGDRFREHRTYATLRKMTKTHPNQSRGILISLTILKNTCLFAAFPYIRVPQTAAKIWNKDSFFKSAPLIPTASTNAFHSINLFLYFTLPSSHQ